MIARSIAAALIGAALLPCTAAAAAALPEHHAGTLRQAGVQLTWPLRSERVTLAAGTVLKVTVRRLTARSPRVTLTLARTGGRRGGLVKRRSLRAGTFSVRLPRAAGARYVLSARSGGRMYRRAVILTPKPVLPAAAPVVAPAAPTPPAGPPLRPPLSMPTTNDTPPRGSGIFPLPEGCPDGDNAEMTLTFDRTEVANGGSVAVTATNSGNTCATFSNRASVYRLTSAGWEDAMSVDAAWQMPGDSSYLLPGEARSFVWTVPGATAMPAGRYAMSLEGSSPPITDVIPVIADHIEFEVVVPPLDTSPPGDPTPRPNGVVTSPPSD